MLTKLSENSTPIPWVRVLCGSFLLTIVYVSAMAVMLFYRMLFLPLAIKQFCPNQEQNVYCIANITHQLAYADQWLAIQFIVYLVLSFLLWPIFRKANGRPLMNLLIVAVITTTVIALAADKLGIELYASFLCPLFIGLLLTAKKTRKIKINYNIN